MNNYTGFSLKTLCHSPWISSNFREPGFTVDLLEFPGSKTNSNIWIYKIIPLRIRFYVLRMAYSTNQSYWPKGWDWDLQFLLKEGVWILRVQRYVVSLPQYCWWTKSCTTKDDDYPIIYWVLTIPGGAGFRPSTVCYLTIKVVLRNWWPENLHSWKGHDNKLHVTIPSQVHGLGCHNVSELKLIWFTSWK